MHIPDSMLTGAICPITAAISIGGIIGAAYYATKAEKPISALTFAATTALIFALQMMNFPINDGTSGHFLGGVLAAHLLGIPFAILSLSLVVTIQSLVFSDGGLTVLGANILNMGIIGAGIGGWLYFTLAATGYKKSLAIAIASWFSVILASFAVSGELAFSGTIPFAKIIWAMLTTHAIIGIGEALITGIWGWSFSFPNIIATHQRPAFIAITAALIIAGLCSPFASEWPDGLEWIAQQYGFFPKSAPAFVGYLANYTLPNITNELFATGGSGLIGVFLTFAFAWGIRKLIKENYLNV